MDIKKRKVYGLIGFPLGHSFSKAFFNEKFEKEHIDAVYRNFPIDNIHNFNEIISENPNLAGLNVTIPYKTEILSFLDSIDAQAEAIGAVNVIKFIRNGENLALKGYNSDIIGFSESIKPLLKPYHKNALILGTGGASKAVVKGLSGLGIESTFVSRRKGPLNYLTYDDLSKDLIDRNLIIVNTTPLGMFPHTDECPDIPYRYLTSHHLCYDLIYNPEITLFMQKAAERGAVVKNGMEMLKLQAIAAWNIWNR